MRWLGTNTNIDEIKASLVMTEAMAGVPGRIAVELPAALLAPKTGGKVSVSDSAAPIIDDEGKTVGGVVVFRGVTGQRGASRTEWLRASGSPRSGHFRPEWRMRLITRWPMAVRSKHLLYTAE